VWNRIPNGWSYKPESFTADSLGGEIVKDFARKIAEVWEECY